MVNEESIVILEKFDLYKFKDYFLKEINIVDFPPNIDKNTLYWKRDVLVILFCIESFLEEIPIDLPLSNELIQEYFSPSYIPYNADLSSISSKVSAFACKIINENNFPGSTQEENKLMRPLICALVNVTEKKQEKAQSSQFSCFLNSSFVRTQAPKSGLFLNEFLSTEKSIPTQGNLSPQVLTKEQRIENDIKIAEKTLEHFVLFEKLSLLRPKFSTLNKTEIIQYVVLMILLFIEGRLRKTDISIPMRVCLIKTYASGKNISYDTFSNVQDILINSKVVTAYENMTLSHEFLKKLESKSVISLKKTRALRKNLKVNLTELIGFFVGMDVELIKLANNDKILKNYAASFFPKQSPALTFSIFKVPSTTQDFEESYKKRKSGNFDNLKTFSSKKPKTIEQILVENNEVFEKNKKLMQRNKELEASEKDLFGIIKWLTTPPNLQTEKQLEKVTEIVSRRSAALKTSEKENLNESSEVVRDLSSEESEGKEFHF